jgi:hypothetical protein
MQHTIGYCEFSWTLDFESEMSEASRPIGYGGRKVQGRLINPPIRITLSAAARRRMEQVGIEPDRVRKAFDYHMHVKPFHATTFFRLCIPAGLRAATPEDRGGAPLQQFSVR